MARLVGAIKRSGLSQLAIANRSDVRQAIISRLVNGKRRNVTAETLEKLAGAIGMRVELRPVGRKGR